MRRSAGPVVLVSLAMSGVLAAREQPVSQTRVTIRGTGANVTIERTAAPFPARAAERLPGAGTPIREAVRLKTEGLDDEALLSYLRERRADLPRIVDASDVRRLRAAGAGESVMDYLSSVAALDVGETGEGGAPAPANEPYPGPDLEGGYGMAYGYPVDGYPIGGYGVFGARGFGFHGFHGSPRLKRFPFHSGRPGFPRRFPSHPLAPRRPMPR
ncbi:MAG: hypothetical protein ACM3SU_14000 [Acidobacteriota bacterium]